VGRKQCCLSKLVPAGRLDAVVWELVKELIQKPQSLQKECQLWQKIQQNQNGAFSEQRNSIVSSERTSMNSAFKNDKL
jgi:hypothetical protein